jgi:hypothetical protein
LVSNKSIIGENYRFYVETVEEVTGERTTDSIIYGCFTPVTDSSGISQYNILNINTEKS